VEQRDDAHRGGSDIEPPAVGGLMAGAPGDPTPAPADASSEPPVGQAASGTSSRRRRILVTVLIWGTTVLAVVGIFAIWANRQMLNPDNWADTSTKLLQDPTIEHALSNYLVNQLYANVDVPDALAARLPAQLKPLSGPLSGALQNVAIAGADRLLAGSRTQKVWRAANRAAVEELVAVIDGHHGAVDYNGGKVTLDLTQVLSSLSDRLGIPNLSSKLPPSAAQLTILKSNQIKAVQDGGRILRGLALLLTILVPLLYVLAVFLAQDRRREALMRVGFAIVIAGLVVFLARKLAVSVVTSSLVKNESIRPAAHNVLEIATAMLSEIAGAFVVVGVPLILAAWFAGPSRWATRARQTIAPLMRDHAWWAFGAVAVLLVLIFIWGPIPATHRLAGIIVFSVLALGGTEVLRRQIERESAGAPA
jgi:hypothetical protein